MSIGAFTAPEVMLTTRPKPRAAIASTVALISSIGVSMLASSALIQASRSQSRKSPGGGPPALLTRMSTCGQAASAAARPSRRGDVARHRAHLDARARSARSSAAVASSASAPRAVMTTLHALAHQRLRAALAQALAGGAHQRPLACDVRDPCVSVSARIRPTSQMPASTSTRAGRDPGGERLAEDQHAHQDRGQRPDHAGLRGHRRRRCARSPSSPSAPARRCTAWR